LAIFLLELPITFPAREGRGWVVFFTPSVLTLSVHLPPGRVEKKESN